MIQIWSFIAEDNEAAADRLFDKIEKALPMLATHPYAGRARPELQQNLRSFPVGNCVIVYIPTDVQIAVVWVLSGYLDLDQDECEVTVSTCRQSLASILRHHERRRAAIQRREQLS